MKDTTNKEAIINNPPYPNSYAESFLLLEKGSGIYLEDAKGKKYVDFGSGISVNALGYGRKDLAKIAEAQMRKLVHVSNLYATQPALDLAAKLVKLGPFTAVHFGNSGSEANETALKFARLYSQRKKGRKKHKFLCFENAFHGRTFGALSCTPTAKYQDPFEPLVPGVESVPFNDVEKTLSTIKKDFAAVIVEVVQGEGGLEIMSEDFASTLNKACHDNDVILIVDEIQTGLGRCGYALASESVGLEPDIVTLSKPLAGGLPLSATLIPNKVNELVHVGEHGTTFGGGPVTTAVAGKVADLVLDPAFLGHVKKLGDYFEKKLMELVDKYNFLLEIRGMGMLRGLVVERSRGSQIGGLLSSAQNEGVLILRSGSNVIRLAPPLVITEKEIEEGITLLDRALAKWTPT